MFRRKEESANDSFNDLATSPVNAVLAASQENASSAPAAQAAAPAAIPSQPASSPTYTSYAPAATAAARTTAADSARSSAPAPSIGNYRPTPVADFTRSTTAARNSEPARPATASHLSTTSSHTSSSAEKSASIKSNRRVLTVGNDILLKGEIATCDRLVIEGRVEAKLSDVHTVEIAECGSFKGTAEVEDAEISGVFEGDLIVRNRLVIYATGEVRGNISYGEIEIERGGKLTGQIKTVTAASPATKAKPAEAASSARPAVAAKETVAA